MQTQQVEPVNSGADLNYTEFSGGVVAAVQCTNNSWDKYCCQSTASCDYTNNSVFAILRYITQDTPQML